MKKTILITSFLLYLSINVFSQTTEEQIKYINSQIEADLIFGPLSKNIAQVHFGRNEELFWVKWGYIKDIEDRKEKMFEYTIDIGNSFFEAYNDRKDRYKSVIISTYNKNGNIITPIDKIFNLYNAALFHNWEELEKAANQLGFTYDRYLYY